MIDRVELSMSREAAETTVETLRQVLATGTHVDDVEGLAEALTALRHAIEGAAVRERMAESFLDQGEDVTFARCAIGNCKLFAGHDGSHSINTYGGYHGSSSLSGRTDLD
jgi:hypothetical protein